MLPLSSGVRRGGEVSDIFEALELFVNRAWRITTSIGLGALAGLFAYIGFGGGSLALLSAAALVVVAAVLGVRWHRRAYPLE